MRRLPFGWSSASDPWRSRGRQLEQASLHGRHRDFLDRSRFAPQPRTAATRRSRRRHRGNGRPASSLTELDNRDGVDVLVADVPTQELLAEYRAGRDLIPLVVLLDGTDSENTVRALSAGAHAVLDRSASRNEIIAAIKAVSVGLVVVAPQLLARLFNEAPFADELFKASAFRARLTRRELEVLVAMADGASNKAIARRLGYFVPHRQVSCRCDTRQARC